MDDSKFPPSYSAQPTVPGKSEGSPPAYSFPASFKIGSKQTVAPLVQSEQLKGHLGLLRAFHTLRTVVEDGKDGRLPGWSREVDPDRRWAWFVGLAVERFERWCREVYLMPAQIFVTDFLPPLDVIMVWHAYLLNPGWYAEDTQRLPVLKQLKLLNEVFTVSLATLGEVVNAEPSASRVNTWTKQMAMPFDPLDAARELTHRNIVCPQCSIKVSIPFITDSGTGYSQQNFQKTCPSCSLTITKGALGVAKFVDVVTSSDSDNKPEALLSGTLYSPAALDVNRAIRIKGLVLLASTFSKRNANKAAAKSNAQLEGEEWRKQVLSKLKYSQSFLSIVLLRAMSRGGGTTRNRILSAYQDGRPFSIDLVGAVLRQGSFVKKMHDLHWTEPDFFSTAEDEVALQHSIARYHAFLDLMTSSPATFLVPTLDIDLAWHTHQLMALKYNKDCMDYVGRYVDHDDKVEESHLSTSFDVTCRAWQARFRVPYMYCGCPLPGETIGQKLARLRSNNSREQPSFLQPPSNPDLLAATHPSDHNAVYPLQHKFLLEKARKKRNSKVVSRRERDAKNLEKGKIDRATYNRGIAHEAAFLYPVPLFFNAGIGAGVGAGIGACAAVSGNIINSGGAGAGCGVGGAACGACGANVATCGSGGGCGGGGGGGGCGGGGGGCGGGGS